MYLEIIDYLIKSIELWSSIMFWNFYNDFFLKCIYIFNVN